MLIRLGNDYSSNQTYFIYVFKMAFFVNLRECEAVKTGPTFAPGP